MSKADGVCAEKGQWYPLNIQASADVVGLTLRIYDLPGQRRSTSQINRHLESLADAHCVGGLEDVVCTGVGSLRLRSNR